jgi:F-type H+-transporting ATPase subunit alpha
LELSQFEEVARFARFGTEVDEVTLRQIRRGERIRSALTQTQHKPRPLAAQVVLLVAVAEGHVDDLPLEEMADFEVSLVDRFRTDHPGLFQEINLTGTLPDGVHDAVLASISAVRAKAGEISALPADEPTAQRSSPPAGGEG